jgi:beta-fructofuranosidase
LRSDLPTYESGDCKNWAHATSKDLYSWELHPLALICEEYGIYSGSVVLDKNNTSGLFPKGHKNGVVAIYTQHKVGTGTEEQSIAYSLDGGYTFELYKKNPVIRLEPESYNFRDPKVIWHKETNKWVMAIAYAHSQQIAFYTSHNLLDWIYTSSFTNQALSQSRPTFECPNLIEIPYITPHDAENGTDDLTPNGSEMSWVLLVSNGGGNPYNGGSGTRYFPGSFNGTHFEAIDERDDRLVDFGTDNYATQYFYGMPETSLPLSLAWAGNIATCGVLPSGPREHWRGMMSLPRTGALVKTKNDVHYWSRPVSIDQYRGKILTAIKSSDAINESTNFADVASGAIILDVRITKDVGKSPLSAILGTKVHFLFKSSKSGEEVDCFLQFGYKEPGFGCDRSKAAGWETNDDFKTMITSSIPRLNEDVQAWDIQIIFDTSVLEVYLGKGLQAGTMAFFPSEPLDTFVLKTDGLTGEVEIVARLQELRRP